MISILRFPRSRRAMLLGARMSLALLLILRGAAFAQAGATGSIQAIPETEARQIAQHAYIFAYPMVVMEMTRRAATRGPDAGPLTNRFAHALVFPDDHFRQVIRPNADTLYSVAWLDISYEPVLLHAPDTKGRYYLFQLMDAWSETIASPGKRTTGTGEGWFALVGPGWKGQLPQAAQRIDCPTNTAWLLGRIQTNNASDYDFVHNLQRGFKLVPLSSYPQEPPAAAYDPTQAPVRANLPPPAQVARMSPFEFFRLFAQLLATNPAHTGDEGVMADLAKIGILPGKPYPARRFSEAEIKAVNEGAQAGAQTIAGFDPAKLPTGKTGWTRPGHYGRYGMDYMTRAIVARYFLGALPVEDAIYLSSLRDSTGQPLGGARRYVMRFDKSGIPPVCAFWSLSLYDDQGYFAANPIKRFAIGDRDALKFNTDGSLDLYIQHDSPGANQESNWLPAPEAAFNLVLRMYWPEPQVLSETWVPPAVAPVSAPTGH